MSENKYQVIDPENDKYKLTSEDILNDAKNKKKRKKRKRALTVLISLLLIFTILTGTTAVLMNVYLSKMNFGDSVGEVHPELDAEEDLSFDNADANADILANLDDNVMWYDDDIYNILLVGVDYGDRQNGQYNNYLTRSDAMILVTINTKNSMISMVSLSRAAYVAIEGHGNKRLNAAHAYGGAKLLVETIEKNYKIRIDRYVTVNFDGFQTIVDSLGGVSVSLSSTEARVILGKSQGGTYLLDGEKAMSFARLRSIDTDRDRTGRQRKILNAIANKLRQASAGQLFDLLDNFLPLVTTNFTKTELVGQIVNVPKYLSYSIQESVVPHYYVPLTLRDGKEVLILDWPKTTAHIHDLLYPGIIPQSANEQN